MDINWADGFNGAITVCDRKGIVVYMNDFSKQQFVKYGGDNLIGESLIDCHPEPSRTKLLEMLKKPIENSYTTEKNGIKKMIHQSPWMENSEFKGIVEISFEIPNPTPNHLKE